jgi:hypothetical protein
MRLTPLLIHLIFHPGSEQARELAVALHRAFNSDPLMPSLRVPTVMLREDGSGLPPAIHDLDEGKHSIVIVLADDFMLVSESQEGRISWPDFVLSLSKQCSGFKHRFLPVQLTKNAWPLHDQLSETNFIAAHVHEAPFLQQWLERRLLIEVCRFLLGQSRGADAPVTLFLSHAKHDIGLEPKLFDAMVAHLQATQPVQGWVDSGQIEAGKSFKDSIESAVQTSAVMILATAAYSGRPWCRREVLLAKKHGRPVVVVDGLNGIDVRSFPYVGNVPVISWGVDGARRAVDFLLKEIVRIEHTKLVLASQAQPDDVVLSSPPELLTLAPLPLGASVLYPDPPLSDEEEEALAPLEKRLATPLQRIGAQRALDKQKIALSISESDDIKCYGLLPEQLDDAMIEISRHLLVRGAVLAYGGHVGSAGYTRALADLVAAHQSLSTLPQLQRIENFVGWPLPFAKMPVERKAELVKLVTFVRTSRPDGVEKLDPQVFLAEPEFFPADSPARRYAWARGMSAMRARQSSETMVRIVIGGKVGPTDTAQPNGGRKQSWYLGRIPGVVEEAISTLQAERPLYLCGAYGGAAALLVDLIEGRPRDEFTWDYQQQAPHANAMRAIYAQEGVPWFDYPEMAKYLSDIGVSGLSRLNGLTEVQNRALFRSRDVTALVELLLEGLGNALALPR